MKTWAKILMWFGLGCGVGFFAGERIGAVHERKRLDKERYVFHELKPVGTVNYQQVEEYRKAVADYRGDTFDENNPELIGVDYGSGDDIPQMPTYEEIEIPNVLEGDQYVEDHADAIATVPADVPPIHPQVFVPQIVTEEEFYRNEWGYEECHMTFYEIDEVLYDDQTQSIVENPDDVIGVGTLFGFGGDPNNPIESLFVINETFGTRYRIDRLDEAFCDAVDGSCAPDEDDDDDEDVDE